MELLFKKLNGNNKSINGIDKPEKIIKEVFDNLNNSQKVSFNLLNDEHLKIIEIEGKKIIQIQIPSANRKQKPIYLKGNPFNGNTYRRLHEGDRHCDDESVRRMIAEQVQDIMDNKILDKFTLHDIETETLHGYRNIFNVYRYQHPWTKLDDTEFLNSIGGYRSDRVSGEEGLTIAGLLMFGKWTSIQEAVPSYFLDYQELSDNTTETRWIDRVVPEGSWSGNLFDFYYKILRKLTADLKVPFVLVDGIRQDDTIVHADYTGRASVKIVKKPEGFLFRNPSVMRIPSDIAIAGGQSDCRNQTMHQMFLMIGLGERAGSGLPKIKEGWNSTNGKLSLYESYEPYEQTILEMNWNEKEKNLPLKRNIYEFFLKNQLFRTVIMSFFRQHSIFQSIILF